VVFYKVEKSLLKIIHNGTKGYKQNFERGKMQQMEKSKKKG
jgi:hypothetical protein